MARHVERLLRRVGGRPWTTPTSSARFVSFVNAPGHPRPAHLVPRGARPGRAGRLRRPGRPRATIPVGAPRDRDRHGRDDDVHRLPGRGHRGRGRGLRAGRAARQSQSSGPTTATSTQSPTTTLVPSASVLSRGIVGTRGEVPFVASPMHKQAFDLRTGQCLDDAAVRVPTYDVAGRPAAWCSSAAARRVRDRWPTNRWPASGSGSPRPARWRSRSPCWNGAAPRSSGLRHCRWTPTRSTTTSCARPPARC